MENTVSTIQYSTVQDSTVQYSKVLQYSWVQGTKVQWEYSHHSENSRIELQNLNQGPRMPIHYTDRNFICS